MCRADVFLSAPLADAPLWAGGPFGIRLRRLPSVTCSACSVLGWFFGWFYWPLFGAWSWCSAMCGIEIRELVELGVWVLTGLGLETLWALLVWCSNMHQLVSFGDWPGVGVACVERWLAAVQSNMVVWLLHGWVPVGVWGILGPRVSRSMAGHALV